MTTAARTATIVMFHHVKAGGSGVLSRLNGIDVAAFRGQLAYIRAHYNTVAIGDLVAAASGRASLPDRAAVLTFDDGYATHARVVLPILLDLSMPAAFFPVSASLIDRAVLDVNKIQCVLATADAGRLVDRIESAIGAGTPAAASYRQQFWKASRWDAPEVVYVKRMLQHGLPDYLRRSLVDDLFREFVTSHERTLADELYMTIDEARELRASGMTIGAHGGRHLRLPTLAPDAQRAEIADALRVLDAAQVPRTGFVFSYANGEFDASAVRILKELGCAAAVTTRPDIASVTTSDLLMLPRLDTNDLPCDAAAEPNAWTRPASGGGNGS